MRLWPGSPLPLGATCDGVGTNSAILSEVAEIVELCLFDEDGSESRVRLTATGRAPADASSIIDKRVWRLGGSGQDGGTTRVCDSATRVCDSASCWLDGSGGEAHGPCHATPAIRFFLPIS
jgi:pullulanase/glycogen debranching enzyme